jgi:hypothetical protein
MQLIWHFVLELLRNVLLNLRHRVIELGLFLWMFLALESALFVQTFLNHNEVHKIPCVFWVLHQFYLILHICVLACFSRLWVCFVQWRCQMLRIKRRWLMNEYGETGGEIQPGENYINRKKSVQVPLHPPWSWDRIRSSATICELISRMNGEFNLYFMGQQLSIRQNYSCFCA